MDFVLGEENSLVQLDKLYISGFFNKKNNASICYPLSLIAYIGYFYDFLFLFWYDDQDASNEIAAELQGVPDLIIGNYSDGNLVATLLSFKLGITQV